MQGEDRRRRTVDKLADLGHLLAGGLLADEVDLVLEDDDVLLTHELERGQVLRRLRLRARLVGGDQEQGTVHDGGAGKHGRHQNAGGKRGVGDERSAGARSCRWKERQEDALVTGAVCESDR
jgi:hypothetical protein